MKYHLLETFFGWLCRPILLWSIKDIITIIIEVCFISSIVYIIKYSTKILYTKKKREKI